MYTKLLCTYVENSRTVLFDNRVRDPTWIPLPRLSLRPAFHEPSAVTFQKAANFYHAEAARRGCDCCGCTLTAYLSALQRTRALSSRQPSALRHPPPGRVEGSSSPLGGPNDPVHGRFVKRPLFSFFWSNGPVYPVQGCLQSSSIGSARSSECAYILFFSFSFSLSSLFLLLCILSELCQV